MRTTPPTCHPELVSGSIPRTKRRQTKAWCQIVPVGVLVLDQIDLPLPVPALQLLFPDDGGIHRVELLESDQAMDSVARGKARNDVGTMLVEACDKVGRNADIDRTERLADEDIDARIAFEWHGPRFGVRWMLKQVQHDGRAGRHGL